MGLNRDGGTRKHVKYSYKVDGRQEDLMSAVLKILDSSVVLPSKIFNLKKRVSKFLSKPLNKSSDVVHFLYCSDDRNILGDYCQSFEDPITSYMLEKITNNPNELKHRSCS